MYFYVVYSRSVCLACKDVVDALEVASAVPDDTVVSVRDAAFARAEECVRDSKFVVCGKVQQAFTVVVQLITSICTEYPIILRSLPFYLQAGTCVRVHQHKKSLLFGDPLHQAVEPMPERSFLFTVTGFRGCIPYHKVDCLVLSRHLKAH